jgi:4-carboxymuconolactone decarboxylase
LHEKNLSGRANSEFVRVRAAPHSAATIHNPGRRQLSADKQYEAGMAVRRKILGDAWVDRTLKNRDEFNTDFQEMISRHVWGDIWTRPAIDHKTRRYMVMSMMIALCQWDEFRLHIRAALASGFTKDDIKEIILQATVYCGAPAGNHAMKEAAETFAEVGV